MLRVARGNPRPPALSDNPDSLLGSLSRDVLEQPTSTGRGLFALPSRDFGKCLGKLAL